MPSDPRERAAVTLALAVVVLGAAPAAVAPL